MQIRNTKQYFDEEKVIAAYLGSIGKSDDDRLNILEECWKNEDTRQRWLGAARTNNPADDANDDRAAASHNHDDQQRHNMVSDIKKAAVIDGHQQMRDAITAIEKNLIARARNEVRQAVEYGGISPMVAAQDAASQAITKAVEEIRAATTLAFRK